MAEEFKPEPGWFQQDVDRASARVAEWNAPNQDPGIEEVVGRLAAAANQSGIDHYPAIMDAIALIQRLAGEATVLGTDPDTGKPLTYKDMAEMNGRAFLAAKARAEAAESRLAALSEEWLARLVFFAAEDLDEASAFNPGNDEHWRHWKTIERDGSAWAFKAARAILSRLSRGGGDE